MQVLRSDGADCFSATLTDPIKLDPDFYKAKQ
jgi:hypothetical protein